MTMSDHERRMLAELARRLGEHDPELASALQDWSGPAERVGRHRRAVAYWRRKVQGWQDAPLRGALSGGLLVITLLLTAAHFMDQPAPAPGAAAVAESFTEQIPEP